MHVETHNTDRISWLRAAVLAPNDGVGLNRELGDWRGRCRGGHRSTRSAQVSIFFPTPADPAGAISTPASKTAVAMPEVGPGAVCVVSDGRVVR